MLNSMPGISVVKVIILPSGKMVTQRIWEGKIRGKGPLEKKSLKPVSDQKRERGSRKARIYSFPRDFFWRLRHLLGSLAQQSHLDIAFTLFFSGNDSIPTLELSFLSSSSLILLAAGRWSGRGCSLNSEKKRRRNSFKRERKRRNEGFWRTDERTDHHASEKKPMQAGSPKRHLTETFSPLKMDA